MAKSTNGPGSKKKTTRPTVGTKNGQTVAPKGYKMELVRKKGEPETKTKTIGSGPMSVSVKTPVGAYIPVPMEKEKKEAVAASKPKKYGKTKAGKFIDKVEKALTPDKSTFKIKGRGRGDGPLKCFKYN